MLYKMSKQRIYYVLFVLLLVVTLCDSINPDEEPVCISRFDYDHKMLRSLVVLEFENEMMKNELIDLKIHVEKLEESNENRQRTIEYTIGRLSHVEKVISLISPGTTYIRWGKSSCPGNGTETVYKGFAAGSHYNNEGAAASYLCLPEDPTWNVYDDTQQSSGTVWGAEYETVYRNENAFFGKSAKKRDVPCSVCRTTRASVLMIPGRHVCYDGWTTEYHGYVMSGHYNHHATDFVCVDERPETLTGGESDQNGKLLYFTEARCGSLRCPPYVDGRELTCSVCSK